MTFDERKAIFQKLEQLRGGRRLVCFFNFDRPSIPANVPGLSTHFHAEAKEALFRVLKELPEGSKIDLCLYTRGGDTNSVWPIVSILREFDPDFEVLVPFRCHSSGTLVALGSHKILMGPLSELSPIDPSTGNQFNPREPSDPKAGMAISVEDVQQYRHFVLEQFKDLADPVSPEIAAPFLQRLVQQVHPLALGNVHRVYQQIKQLARGLLGHHRDDHEELAPVIEALTTKFYSHLHMINRVEAKEILGEQILFAEGDLASTLDELLRAYEDTFHLRDTFILARQMGDDATKDVRFFGGVVEGGERSYAYETSATIRQFSKIPQNVQVQLPAGQPMPIVAGLPRDYEIKVSVQGWVHNKAPQGVTV